MLRRSFFTALGALAGAAALPFKKVFPWCEETWRPNQTTNIADSPFSWVVRHPDRTEYWEDGKLVRVFARTVEPQTLYFSKIGDPTNWDCDG